MDIYCTKVSSAIFSDHISVNFKFSTIFQKIIEDVDAGKILMLLNGYSWDWYMLLENFKQMVRNTTS